MTFSPADPPAVAALPAVAQRPVTTGARTPDAEPAPADPDLRCWAKFRRGPAPYHGEYGFDWMDWQRDPDPKNLNDDITKVMDVNISEFDYCYDERTREYVSVAADPHLKRKLQGEYRRVLVYGEDYYAGWLSVRPGQEVTLQLAIEALNADPAKDDYLTFGAHASYQVIVNGQANEAIRITPTAGTTAQNPQVVDVTIKNLKPCADTSLQVFDEKGKVVGQLNVVDNTKTYKLPVRVVYVVKNTPDPASAVPSAAPGAAVAKLRAQLNGVTRPDGATLPLKQYLNEYSLNQAHIQVEFEHERSTQTCEIRFDENEWAKAGFYDKSKGWLQDRKYLDTKQQARQEDILNHFLREYAGRYEKPGTAPFRGVLLFMTDVRFDEAENKGGVAFAFPEPSRQCIIFQSNLGDASTYVHEISHVLGLEHSFLKDEDKFRLLSAKEEMKNLQEIINNRMKDNEERELAIKKNIIAIESRQSVIKQYEVALKNPDYAYKQRVEDYVRQYGVEIKEAKDKNERMKRDIKEANTLNNEARSYIKYRFRIYNNNPYKWKYEATNCLMDYNKNRAFFYYGQWNVLQKDLVRFYGHIE